MTEAEVVQRLMLEALDLGDEDASTEALVPPPSLARKAEMLRRETFCLIDGVRSFRDRAEALLGPLDEIVSSAEGAAMVTPRANVLGTLENLLNQDLPDVLRQLEELRGHLESKPELEG
jgi:hypothetical protein